MKLEELANELLLEVFGFLTTADRLHAFHDLNHRFERLLSDSFQTINLDMRSISTGDFNIIRQRYLPTIIRQVISLQLADSADSPSQIQSFLFSDPTLRQCHYL